MHTQKNIVVHSPGLTTGSRVPLRYKDISPLRDLSGYEHSTYVIDYDTIENCMFFSDPSGSRSGRYVVESLVSTSLFRSTLVGSTLVPFYDRGRLPVAIIDPFTSIKTLDKRVGEAKYLSLEDLIAKKDEELSEMDIFLVNKRTDVKTRVQGGGRLVPEVSTTLIWTFVNLVRSIAKDVNSLFIEDCILNTPWGKIPRFYSYIPSYNEEIRRIEGMGLKDDKEKAPYKDAAYKQLRDEILLNTSHIFEDFLGWIKHPSNRGRVVFIEFTPHVMLIRTGVESKLWNEVRKKVRERNTDLFRTIDGKKPKNKSLTKK